MDVTVERSHVGRLQVEKEQSAPERVVAQTQMKKEGCRQGGEEEHGRLVHKDVGEDCEEEAANMEECEDAEGVVRWRSISQEGSDELWKELCGTMAEEVWEKYEVDEATKGAHQGTW